MRLIALSFLALLAGCTPRQQGMVDTLNSAIWGTKDVTVTQEQIDSRPFSTMYLRVNDGPRVFVGLGYIEQGNSKWLSQDSVMLVTRQGRLLKTIKLHGSNLSEVIATTPDPLIDAKHLINGQTWSRTILWTEDGQLLRSAILTSRFTRAEQDQVLTLAGKVIPCQVWYEDVQSTAPDSQWRNTFWIDASNGQVRQSYQMLAAGRVPVEMTMLKPAP